LIAARAAGVASLVRVPGSETSFIKPVLDSGAEGIIVPMVHSAAEVRKIVADCRYPTQGCRGFGPRRPANYGREGLDTFLKRSNEEVFVIVQIEHIDAVREIDEIVATPGLDSVVLGPMDLSGSMGKLGKTNDPEVDAVMKEVVRKARDAGIYVGCGVGMREEMAQRFFDMGVHWVQCGCDFDYIVQTIDRLYAQVRSRLAK
jgi:2-dehydro-3-deoxyglucarate aldolase/4-hydroxy-2-oxoheptanedioate aldolase